MSSHLHPRQSTWQLSVQRIINVPTRGNHAGYGRSSARPAQLLSVVSASQPAGSKFRPKYSYEQAGHRLARAARGQSTVVSPSPRRRHVDDALERRVRRRIAEDAQIRDDILHFLALEERHRTDDLRRHAPVVACLPRAQRLAGPRDRRLGARTGAAQEAAGVFVELLDGLRDVIAQGHRSPRTIIQIVDRSGMRSQARGRRQRRGAQIGFDNLAEPRPAARDGLRRRERRGAIDRCVPRAHRAVGARPITREHRRGGRADDDPRREGPRVAGRVHHGHGRRSVPHAAARARRARAREDAQLEEERRLAYVAITRARKQPILTHARTRRVWGEIRLQGPSRFLEDLPTHALAAPKRPVVTPKAPPIVGRRLVESADARARQHERVRSAMRRTRSRAISSTPTRRIQRRFAPATTSATRCSASAASSRSPAPARTSA